MGLKEVYDFLEENGKSDLVEIVKNENKLKAEFESKYTATRKDLNSIKDSLESKKSILDIIERESIDSDGLKGLIDKSRSNESDLDKALRRIDALEQEKVQDKKDKEEAEARERKLAREQKISSIRKEFSDHAKSIDPDYLEAKLDSFEKRGILKIDDNGQGIFERDGEAVSIKEAAEKFVSENHNFVVGRDGARSNPGNNFSKTDGGYGEKNETEILTDFISSLPK